MEKIRKILIANRGEIAVRIIQSSKELGIKTVAIYSQIDCRALHVKRADEVYKINNRGIEPYLDMDQIIEAAELTEADAIHPGYGFLSENYVFAREVITRGLIFIGPSPEAIALMGDKLKAKKIAASVQVPIIPGKEIINELQDQDFRKIEELGFPLMIKAKAGGGGKGMRIVNTEFELKEEIGLAMSEAKDAFGDGTVFLEKLIQNPRHIEIQVLADAHGQAVYLFERECSIQRRHQKVIEEAPSSILDSNLRKEMGEAALRLVRACNYSNAGTVEFILDGNKDFYFLEMNTRLQVEHPVTEFITGLDLVKEQIRISEGKNLSFSQHDLKINGHAIELRVYAENPRNSFLPDIGKLDTYIAPKGINVRLDDGYEQGMEVPVEYDPLISKLIVHGSTRKEAIERMKRAIGEYEIVGVFNTLEFGAWVMDDKDFCDGNFNTGFISEKLMKFTNEGGDETSSMIAALAGFIFNEESRQTKAGIKPVLKSQWRNNRK